MSLTSKKLAEVILAIVAIALIVGVVLCFTTPLGDAFSGIFRKQHEVANGDIWNQGNYDIPYTVRLKTNMAEGGTVEFTGEYAGLTSLQLRGEQTVTLKATPNTGYQFTGWYVGDTQVSTDAEYSYTVNGAISIEARFGQAFGLYQTGTNYGTLKTSWEDLIANGGIVVTDGVITGSNNSYLGGDLLLPTDGSIAAIGDNAFKTCTNLTSVEIPGSVTSIGQAAFYECFQISRVTIPNSVTSIGNDAFYKCVGLTSIEIPASVTTIGQRAFDTCKGLTSVVIPDGVTSISIHAFYGCTSLASVEIPASVTSIGDYAFSSCGKLTSVTFAEGSQLTTIGQRAFDTCTSLTGVEIPDSVTSISYRAFNGCTKLASIEIPDSVTSIGAEAFSGCTGLTSIEIHSETMVAYSSNMLKNCNALTAIYVPANLVNSYKAASGWSDFAAKIVAIP